jgi:hypothetical protein
VRCAGRGGFALLIGVALVVTGCAELRTPPPPPPPVGLVGAVGDPLRAAVDAAALAFADRGTGLAGRPAEAAEAIARLEFVAQTLPADPRYARLAEGLGRDLALAQDEARDALGVMASAPSPAVQRALLAAAARLRAGERAAAGAALTMPIFRPGGIDSVVRLGTLGPLPQAALATSQAQQAILRADATGIGRRMPAPGTASALGLVDAPFAAETSTGF